MGKIYINLTVQKHDFWPRQTRGGWSFDCAGGSEAESARGSINSLWDHWLVSFGWLLQPSTLRAPSRTHITLQRLFHLVMNRHDFGLTCNRVLLRCSHIPPVSSNACEQIRGTLSTWTWRGEADDFRATSLHFRQNYNTVQLLTACWVFLSLRSPQPLTVWHASVSSAGTVFSCLAAPEPPGSCSVHRAWRVQKTLENLHLQNIANTQTWM